MDPQSVTLLALVVLAAAGATVAVTGFIHLRRGSSPGSDAATGAQDATESPAEGP